MATSGGALNGAEGERNGTQQPRHVRWSRLVGPAEPRAWGPKHVVRREERYYREQYDASPPSPYLSLPARSGTDMLSNEKLGKFKR